MAPMRAKTTTRPGNFVTSRSMMRENQALPRPAEVKVRARKAYSADRWRRGATPKVAATGYQAASLTWHLARGPCMANATIVRLTTYGGNAARASLFILGFASYN